MGEGEGRGERGDGGGGGGGLIHFRPFRQWTERELEHRVRGVFCGGTSWGLGIEGQLARFWLVLQHL